MKNCNRCGERPVHNATSKAGGGRGVAFRDFCALCARLEQAAPVYVPLDELLEQKPVKVLRALRNFRGSWVERADLYEAMGLPPWSSEPKLLELYHQVFRRLLVGGYIERRHEKHRWGYHRNFNLACWYRITAAGLLDLDRRMRAAQIDVVATEAELEAPDRPLRRRRAA